MTMRFMMLVKASAESEAGVMPSKELIAAMTTYNEEMAKAGVMLAGEGLQPSSRGVRITFKGCKRLVTDGPFAETKELLAGFWMIQVKSRAEAIEWASRIPFSEGEVVEIRPVFETEDFPAEVMPPEEKAREETLRAALEKKARPQNSLPAEIAPP
jgi:hypothetical protein